VGGGCVGGFFFFFFFFFFLKKDYKSKIRVRFNVLLTLAKHLLFLFDADVSTFHWRAKT
jgi:hypothetical protein